MRAPDYIDPLVGWRVWDVAEPGSGLSLLSPLYRSTWPHRRELIAACRPRAEAALALVQSCRFGHAPPDMECSCGIYAGNRPEQAVAYMSRFFKPRRDVIHRVLGTVALWGTVVACEQGWRATHAYPSHIYVPVPTRRRLPRPGRVKPPRRPAADIALGLAAYGVPIELVECSSLGDLAKTLAVMVDDRGAQAFAA